MCVCACAWRRYTRRHLGSSHLLSAKLCSQVLGAVLFLMARSASELSLPPDVVVKSIPPNGWCFYDCVREHLHCNAADGDLVLTTSGTAALCLSCLALRREEFADFVEDADDIQFQRRQNVFQCEEYLEHIGRLDDFQIYVLDKLEAVLTSNQVVDTLHYADSPEIEAFLRHFDLTLLRVRAANEWSTHVEDIGAVHGLQENEVMRTVSDEAHLRSLMQHENIDLQLMHYQYIGFEHFDIVHFVNSSFGIAAEKKAGWTIAFLGILLFGVFLIFK